MEIGGNQENGLYGQWESMGIGEMYSSQWKSMGIGKKRGKSEEIRGNRNNSTWRGRARDLQNIRRESMAFEYIDEEGCILDNKFC
jgi:hypothetical protein